MEKIVKKATQKVIKPTLIAKDKNPNAKVVGLPKRNFGFAKDYLFISEDAFTEDLKP
jgi:hypothetical protein